jgi:membrane protein DedA with SNARE-associated domain
MSHFEHLIAGLNHWQIDGVVTWLLLQGALFTVVPEEVILMSLGVLIAKDRVGVFEGFFAVELGLLTANLFMVFLASRFGQLQIFQKDSVKRALELFKRKGNWIIFGTRFTPFIRMPIYASAGLSGVTLFEFFKIDATASLIQVPLLMSVGFWIGTRSGSIMAAYRAIGQFALVVVACGVLAFLTRRFIGAIRASE